MTLMGLVKDFKGLLIARIFLGVTEAGLFPGVVFCAYSPKVIFEPDILICGGCRQYHVVLQI
jgi:hypothetical protein